MYLKDLDFATLFTKVLKINQVKKYDILLLSLSQNDCLLSPTNFVPKWLSYYANIKNSTLDLTFIVGFLPGAPRMRKLTFNANVPMAIKFSDWSQMRLIVLRCTLNCRATYGMGQAFWKNRYIAPPFIEPCPYSWKC